MNVLFVSYYQYPNGDAGAIRQHVLARLFSNIGANVFIVSMGESTRFNKKDYDGINYMSLRNPGNDKFTKIKNYLGYKKNLEHILKSTSVKYDIILVVDIPFHALYFVKRFAKRNDVKLLHDSVEWYSPQQFKFGSLSMQYILKDLYNKRWIDSQFKVIAISKYLEKHFKDKQNKTTRIPVIMDIRNMSCKKQTNLEKLTLLYAGSPGKKDYLKEIIEGIALLEKQIIDKINFRLIGVDKEQLIELCSVRKESIDRLGSSLTAIGKVLRQEVIRNLEEADFTVLLRSPTQRYAKAGFPTKVVESLATGTPVICNITSDLGDYIHDGENGIIVEDCSAEAFSIAIKKALDLTFEQRKIMYENARRCAEENFDYRLYKETLQEFIKAY